MTLVLDVTDRALAGEAPGAWREDKQQTHQAVAGFLIGYANPKTRAAYAADLRMWADWCRAHDYALLDPELRRVHVEMYMRGLEERGRAPKTISRRLGTLVMFYRWCMEEGLIDKSPAAHVRKPKIDTDGKTPGMTRNEVSLILLQAGIEGGTSLALVELLASNGLRISEAMNADIEHMGEQKGHHTLTITRKGGKTEVIPLAPRVWIAVMYAIGERTTGPIFLNAEGTRLRRDQAAWIVERLAKRAGLGHVHPHMFRVAAITAALDAGVPLREVQAFAGHADPKTTCMYDRNRQSLDRHATHIVATLFAGSSR